MVLAWTVGWAVQWPTRGRPAIASASMPARSTRPACHTRARSTRPACLPRRLRRGVGLLGGGGSRSPVSVSLLTPGSDVLEGAPEGQREAARRVLADMGVELRTGGRAGPYHALSEVASVDMVSVGGRPRGGGPLGCGDAHGWAGRERLGGAVWLAGQACTSCIALRGSCGGRGGAAGEWVATCVMERSSWLAVSWRVPWCPLHDRGPTPRSDLWLCAVGAGLRVSELAAPPEDRAALPTACTVRYAAGGEAAQVREGVRVRAPCCRGLGRRQAISRLPDVKSSSLLVAARSLGSNTLRRLPSRCACSSQRLVELVSLSRRACLLSSGAGRGPGRVDGGQRARHRSPRGAPGLPLPH